MAGLGMDPMASPIGAASAPQVHVLAVAERTSRPGV